MTLDEYTSKLFGCTVDELYSKSRLTGVVGARQVCMVMIQEFTSMTPRQIAERYGQTRTMVIHSKKTVQNHCDTEKDYREKVQKVREFVNGHLPIIGDYIDEDMKLYASLV